MHHCYFDPDKLSDEQKARWEPAIAQYNRILERNVERQFSRMSEQDKRDFLSSFAQCPGDDKLIEDDVRKLLRQFYGMSGGASGNPRSALLARLLDGKEPLRAPPPSTFHHPWYEVIEEDGPFAVMLSDAHVSSQPARPDSPDSTHSICVDHCPWTVVRLNDAARRLFVLQDRLEKTAHRECGDTCFAWTPELLADVLAAYADGPELLVRYEEWSPYRLLPAGRQATGDAPETPPEVTPASLKCTNSVFDTRALCPGQCAPCAADDKESGACLGWRLEKKR